MGLCVGATQHLTEADLKDFNLAQKTVYPMELLTQIAKASPGIALAGLAILLFYKFAMRALDSIDANTKALTALEVYLRGTPR